MNTNQPVPNHFYGVFENGEIKCRGIELRRKDSPEILVEMQLRMIKALCRAKNERQFKSLFPKVIKILKRYIEKLKSAQINDITITKRLSKTEYENNIPQKIIIEQLNESGWDIQPGQKIKYIIIDSENKNPKRRYTIADLYSGKIDREKYRKLMIRATSNLLLPFGVTESDISSVLDTEKQNTLKKYIV